MPTHRCPALQCPLQVSNRLLACRTHWHALSRPVQDAIHATAHLNLLHPDRRAAFEAAREEWRG